MTLKLSCNGSGLPKAPSDKDKFLKFITRTLEVQPDCSVFDLDNPYNQHDVPPISELGIWVDSWHFLVDALGSREDAEVGIRAARSLLYEMSTKFNQMVFSADTTKPPLDQFGAPDRSLELLFRESTCYTSIRPIAIYHGRKIYHGSNRKEKKHHG